MKPWVKKLLALFISLFLTYVWSEVFFQVTQGSLPENSSFVLFVSIWGLLSLIILFPISLLSDLFVRKVNRFWKTLLPILIYFVGVGLIFDYLMQGGYHRFAYTSPLELIESLFYINIPLIFFFYVFDQLFKRITIRKISSNPE